jgi:hypothetical protein
MFSAENFAQFSNFRRLTKGQFEKNKSDEVPLFETANYLTKTLFCGWLPEMERCAVTG